MSTEIECYNKALEDNYNMINKEKLDEIRDMIREKRDRIEELYSETLLSPNVYSFFIDLDISLSQINKIICNIEFSTKS